MPLKKVVSTIINYFDDDLTADLILKITQATLEKWQTLSADLPVQKEAMAA